MPQLTIDWIALTYPDEVPWEETAASFIGAWSTLDHGGNGYKSAAQNSHVTILHGGNPGMGHHLRLNSHGLRQVEAQDHFAGWPRWLREEISRRAKPTRIDLALDDDQGLVDFPTIRDHLQNRHLTTRHKQWSHSQDFSFATQDAKPEGEIVRLGSRSSSTYLRIYDREARVGTPGPLIRFEIECKKSAALRVACQIACAVDDDALGALAVGILRNLVEFRQPTTDSNLRRAPLAPWWDQFCGEAERVRLGAGKPLRTIAKVRQWLDRQVAPSLQLQSLAAKLEGADPQATLEALVKAGEGRLNTAHLQMLHDHACTMRPRITVRGRGGPETPSPTNSLEAEELDRSGKGDDHAGD